MLATGKVDVCEGLLCSILSWIYGQAGDTEETMLSHSFVLVIGVMWVELGLMTFFDCFGQKHSWMYGWLFFASRFNYNYVALEPSR